MAFGSNELLPLHNVLLLDLPVSSSAIISRKSNWPRASHVLDPSPSTTFLSGFMM
jgi:hypothetical protein